MEPPEGPWVLGFFREHVEISREVKYHREGNIKVGRLTHSEVLEVRSRVEHKETGVNKAGVTGKENKENKTVVQGEDGKGRKNIQRQVRERDVHELSVFYANSRSVINKVDMLRSIACVEKLDIIGITETWLDTAGKHFLPEVEIEGYNLFHKDREGRRGGGVALYVKSTINSYVNTTIKTDSNTESLWIDIIMGRKKLVVGIVYRPPDLGIEGSASLLQELTRASRYNNVCIM